MEDDLRDALDRLFVAIHDAGPVPGYHRDIMRKHRREWPTLWEALDAVAAADGWKNLRRSPRPASLAAAVRASDTALTANDLSTWPDKGAIWFGIRSAHSFEQCIAEERVGNTLVNVTRGNHTDAFPFAAGASLVYMIPNDVEAGRGQ